MGQRVRAPGDEDMASLAARDDGRGEAALAERRRQVPSAFGAARPTVDLPSRTSSQAPPGSAPTSTSRIVSPLRKPSRRTALPLRRQPSSACQGDAASAARAAAAASRSTSASGAPRAARRRRAAGSRRKQPVVLALDQRGVEVGVGERRRRDQPREELDVVGDADDPVAARAPARMRAERAARGRAPQTISLAIIGS